MADTREDKVVETTGYLLSVLKDYRQDEQKQMIKTLCTFFDIKLNDFQPVITIGSIDDKEFKVTIPEKDHTEPPKHPGIIDC